MNAEIKQEPLTSNIGRYGQVIQASKSEYACQAATKMIAINYELFSGTMKENAYTSPIVNRNINTIFCLRGTCNFQKIGIGMPNNTKSVSMLKGAFVKETISRFMHVPPTDGSQKYSTGVHMNINPKMVHTRKADMTATVTWHIVINRFSGNRRRYNSRIEIFVRNKATE